MIEQRWTPARERAHRNAKRALRRTIIRLDAKLAELAPDDDARLPLALRRREAADKLQALRERRS